MMSGPSRQADMLCGLGRSVHAMSGSHTICVPRGRRNRWEGCLIELDFAHMCSKQLTKVLGIARKHAPLVPNHGPRIFDRFALVRDADNVQPVAMSSYGRRNDRDAEPGFCERQQGVRRTAFYKDVRLESRETADRINVFRPTNPESSRSNGYDAIWPISVMLPCSSRNDGWQAATSSTGGTGQNPKRRWSASTASSMLMLR